METVEVLSIPSIDCFKYGWRIIGSCNGVLCVEGRLFPPLLCLWNPVIREVREIPLTRNGYPDFSLFGFGFSNIVNDYKIVRFSERKKKEEDLEYNVRIVEVYSLSTGSWKELEFGAIQKTGIISVTVSVDGTMVWLGTEDSFPVLISFDIATEVFTSTPIPSVVRVFPTNLGVYQNKLAIFGHCGGSHFMDIWMMKQVASESGKSLSCPEEYSIDTFSYALDPLCFWRNEIVCRDKESEAKVEGKPKYLLKLFNLTTKEWKEFHNFSSAYNCCDGFNYVSSLVSVCNTQVQ